MTSKRVVWVLGSGFSRPLGGPLLDELLSPRMGSLVAARFGDPEEAHHHVREVFARHLKQGLRLWENAEQFLDILDQARENRDLARLITGQEEPNRREQVFQNKASPIDTLWQDACMAVADECRFCHGVQTSGEAWQPYKRWRKLLSDQDLIITFNYDRVLEALELSAVLPGNARLDGSPIPSRTVYKLHGSVDWVLADDKTIQRHNGRGQVPFLATPGPTKFKHTNDEGPLSPLWSGARYALIHAEAVVFMGYRFPPTDSHALGSILGALGDNRSEHLRLFTVLGPRTQDEDTVRLQQLLHRTMRSAGREHDKFAAKDPLIVSAAKALNQRIYDLEVLPLYAQDYMVTMSRAEFG